MAEVNETPKPTEANKDARMFAMLAHLLAIFTCFVGPLVIWLIKKDEHPFVEEQGKEALNFQITIAIVWVASWVVPVILTFLACVVPFLVAAIWIVNLIFCIMACVAANKGEHYRYPVSLRLIK
jgi:uncharacterized Tic20 family protein